MFKERVNALFALSIPNLHRLIITAGHDQTTIGRKPDTIN